MVSSDTSVDITSLLIRSFLENTLDYFKLFVPLFLVYKIYKNYHKLFTTHDCLIKFLNLYTFGITAQNENNPPLTDSNNNNSNDNHKNLHIKLNVEDENDHNAENNSNGKKILSFLICFTGLQISFLMWGLMQERIMKFGYSESTDTQEIEERQKQFKNFKNSQFLVLSNRFAGLILSLIILIIFNSSKIKLCRLRLNSFKSLASIKNWPPLFICSYASLSNVLSSWFQYESLKYVSFTSQLLAKSSKSVFVMLTGKVISNKNYKLHEYVCVFIIGIGIFLFSDINKNNLKDTNKIIATTFPGFLCLLGYLISDSFTSTWQDNLIKKYSISSLSLMFITNLYSCAYTLVSLISQNQLKEALNFMNQHSEITYHIVLLSIASAIGQIFIFITIEKFGALVFSLMMTTRQILSIFLSSIVFQHSMSLQSIFGVSLIFFALFLQQYIKFRLKVKKSTPFTKL